MYLKITIFSKVFDNGKKELLSNNVVNGLNLYIFQLFLKYSIEKND